MPNRLLFVTTGLGTGGAEQALYRLLASGLGRDRQVSVVSLRDEGTHGQPIRALGHEVSCLGLGGRLPSPGMLVELARRVRAFQPDVIQGWMYHGNLAASLAARLAPGRPAVTWGIRQSLYGLTREKLATRQIIRANRWLSRGPGAIVYNSHVSRSQHEAFGFSGARGTIIPNGFNLDRLAPSSDVARRVRSELSVPADARLIGHVARLHPMKDHPTFLRAAVTLARELPDLRVLLVGRAVDLVSPELSGIVPDDMTGRFLCLGQRPDAAALMQALDVFCLSSNSEAFPNVLGEAMAMEVPCVTTDVGDAGRIVGDTGIVVPPGDSAAMSRGLSDLLTRPVEARRILGRAARQRIESHYSMTRAVEAYNALYRDLATRI
ncbi:hypothetical protein CKO28_23555 [Rhodovibrio sodomensis]|uniref:Glycosyltransferase subfamily 4-like N-terminal domain-containing protein n=1 Tax=Rhodovibrio sodomensis TaxID=1088 RepID=A0ABS1DMN1_9PROT|nr:glycosyltransferase [Rhodovibrio sodomensis]MBK1670988.1 hypothetical protein [Rhodovibrio sodomensis]